MFYSELGQSYCFINTKRHVLISQCKINSYDLSNIQILQKFDISIVTDKKCSKDCF